MDSTELSSGLNQFMATLATVLDGIDNLIWGLPMLILLMGTGLLLTVRLNLLQITKLPKALKLILTAENVGEGDVTSYKSLCTALAASAGILGIGTTTQANAIILACEGAFDIPKAVSASILAVAIAVVILGGLRSISNVASSIVPFMSVVYFIFGVGILVVRINMLPAAFSTILESAFTGHAALGGFGGAAFASAIRNGVARGIFSNEAGLGSAPIASAAAKTEWPAEQGLISMTGTFIDTIIICSITGLSLIVTGAWTGNVKGPLMTQAAFAAVYPDSGTYILTICLVLFAFTTILGWAYYGERCMSYLFGVKSSLPYRLGYVVVVGIGPFLPLDIVWLIADITNGLMAFPNLVALLGLSGVVVAETKKYFDHLAAKEKAENE